ADRAKLARSDETLEARQHRAEWEAVIEGRSQPVATSLLVRESLQRVAALAGAALCGIILVMATLASVYERTGGIVEEGTPVELRRRRGAAPAMMPATSSERELLKKMSEQAAGGAGQVLNLQIDPRSRTATVRVLLPKRLRDTAGPAGLRESAMREGYRAALAFRRAASSLRQPEDLVTVVDVSVIAPAPSPSGDSSIDWLLVGSLSRADLVVDADVLTEAELQGFYTELSPPWWAPQLAAP
ncbi:MAG TPA: hypothetical protein VK689_09880, partial [Armatimonadota bacterium]|nr:hypothetical protein [Armatimonadota bacterium]